MHVLSIIVPVYKVEDYLPRCINSILAQTFTDFELILIDDGSPDSSGDIIDKYAAIDSRIIAIHQENQGVSAARNAGLRIAGGKYIGFVDSDDWVDNDLFEHMISSAEDENADLVCCPVYMVNSDEGIDSVSPPQLFCEGTLSQTAFVSHVFDYPRTVYAFVCNKLFVHNKIKNLFDTTLSYGEDLTFLLSYCQNAERFSLISESGYYYYIHETSAFHRNYAKSSVLSLVLKRGFLDGILNEFDKAVSQAAEDDYLDSCLLCYQWTKGEKDEYYYQARHELCSYVNENIVRILKNARIPLKKKLLIGLYYMRSLPAGQRVNDVV